MGILKRIWAWIDDRTGITDFLGPIMSHPVPPGSGWFYVFGSATLFAFIVQVVTGIALATAYVPSSGQAYDSLKFITDQAPLGHLLRGIHYWGASAMVLFVGLHAVRTFLFGSYKFPREMSWLSGVVLLLVTLGMAFTGQLLRWDQTAIWSVVVGAEQAARVPLVGNALARFTFAGDTIGGATLSRFFAFHVFFIPALIFAVLGLHIYLVLRNGISEPPVPGEPVDPKTYRQRYQEMLHRIGVPFWPDAAWRDTIFGVGMITALVVLALVFGPPALSKPPDPTILQAYPRPDWYFLWYFAALALLPGGFEPFVIVLGPILFGVLLFLLPLVGNRGERSPWRRPWAIAVVVMVVLIIGTLWVAGERAPWSPNFTAQALPAQVVQASSGDVATGADLFYKKGC